MSGKKKVFSDEQKNMIIEHYKNCYSVLETSKIMGVAYVQIKRILEEEGVFESFGGENYKRLNTERIKKSTLKKYGVDNISKIRQSGWTTQNHIGYERLAFDEEYKKYSARVMKLTRKNAQQIKENTHCFYTGIEFSDNNQKEVNPNDPRKRSIDHRKSVIECFLESLCPEECASLDNIVFALKYVNTIKGNTKEDSFIPIAKNLRERLLI
ncbi:MAG: hypothetical protein WCI60_02450 [bacterium]